MLYYTIYILKKKYEKDWIEYFPNILERKLSTIF